MDKGDVVARFMHEKFLFPRRDMADMCHVDYVKNIAVVAVLGEIGFEKIIGVGASFFQPASNTVEVAFSVLKEWQGKRIASVLMKMVERSAKKGGIKGMVAYTLPKNQRMMVNAMNRAITQYAAFKAESEIFIVNPLVHYCLTMLPWLYYLKPTFNILYHGREQGEVFKRLSRCLRYSYSPRSGGIAPRAVQKPGAAGLARRE